MPAEKHTVNAIFYVVITTLLSSIFWVLINRSGHMEAAGGIYLSALMWAPAVAAFVTIGVRHLGVRSLGLRWGGTRYVLWGYLTPLAYAAIAYGLIWTFGLGSFPNPQAIVDLTGKLGWHMTSASAFVPTYFLFIATIWVVLSVTRAVGEEIGWRGLLTPQLVSRFGFTGGSLLTGVIWAAWHMPLLLFADYSGDTPWWFAMPCFWVLVLSLSIILTWLRLKSRSVWPCALLHASHNAFIQAFFTPLTLPHGQLTRYVIDEFGVAVPVVSAVFALFFWFRRGQAMGERPLEPVAA
ncbi:MAG TPA: type II CAAX endopeptidase family protein [Steroidobacteraceae bacterium]|nr:type II CAAX endopeptidase family protein [Steroidobacteraceae bacterium]